MESVIVKILIPLRNFHNDELRFFMVKDRISFENSLVGQLVLVLKIHRQIELRLNNRSKNTPTHIRTHGRRHICSGDHDGPGHRRAASHRSDGLHLADAARLRAPRERFSPQQELQEHFDQEPL